MIENKKKYLPLLNILKRLKPKDVSDIMEFLTDDAIDNICECVYNVIHTDINLPSRKKAKLRNFIKSNCSIHRINKITSKKEALFKRRKALSQEGKGLPLLLGAAIPFLTDLIFGRK
jgi:putative N-acetylmannosamine-6-phosphate epimerase